MVQGVLVDCGQPELCDCDSCDAARREQVRAFAERWFAERAGSESSGVREVSAAQTVRPPRMTRRAVNAA